MPSATANLNTIREFLSQTLELATRVEIVLYQMDFANRRSIIWVNKWDGVRPPLEEYSQEILEAAKNHASFMGGTQRFGVSAFDLDRDEKTHEGPINTRGVTVEGAMHPAGEGDPSGSEPPTNEGLLAHLMRHNNEMFRLHNASVGALTSHLARTVEKQADQIDKLMGDRMGTIEVVEGLLSQKHTRDLEVEKTKADITRKNEMWEKVAQLAPIIINKISGQELVRQKHSALEATVMSFLESLPSGQLETIRNSGIFNERQLVLFGTVMEQVTKAMVTQAEKADMRKTTERATVGDMAMAAVAAAANMAASGSQK